MLGPLPEEGNGGGAGTVGGFWLVVIGGGVDCTNGDEDTGIEARGGLGGLAGRTVAGPDWTLALMRFSISSISDWDDGWRGTVSLCDIFREPLFNSSFLGKMEKRKEFGNWIWKATMEKERDQREEEEPMSILRFDDLESENDH